MSYRFAHYLVLSFAGALLICMMLFLLSEFPLSPGLLCCGFVMDFPFPCLLILLSLFGSMVWAFHSRQRRSSGVLSSTTFSRLFEHLISLVLSDYLRGWLVVSLLLAILLILLGAALLVSLSLSFAWSALALGCLDLLGGLLVLLLGGFRLGCR